MKFFVHSLEGTGHLNACIGLSQSLAQRGHEIVFVVNETLVPEVERNNFRAIPLRPRRTPTPGDPARNLAQKFMDCGRLSGRSSYEKIDCMLNKENFIGSIAEVMIDFNPQIKSILAAERPHCWIQDHFIFPPAVGEASIPWILVASANPLCYIRHENLPPCSSGYPTNVRPQWERYEKKWSKVRETFCELQDKINNEFGFVNRNHYIRDSIFLRSPYLTVYQFPKELDYTDIVDLPQNFVSCDAFGRREVEPFKLPQEFLDKPGEKLIYFSLGSMGGFDIKMQQRLVNMLGRMPHKCIISKGPRGDELKLPPNCWGKNTLPQPEIIEQVDLVITHGGNNSFTETFAAGKPMIVMPLFGDQYDNAQRLVEKGYGIRLEPYRVEEHELVDAIDKLLTDDALCVKLEAIKDRAKKEKTNQKLCEIIKNMLSRYNF